MSRELPDSRPSAEWYSDKFDVEVEILSSVPCRLGIKRKGPGGKLASTRWFLLVDEEELQKTDMSSLTLWP